MNMDIRNSIAELLSLHDCVIIPGFGGFIGNYSPARIDAVHHTFHPPAKTLLFNINLKQNDGLLANAVASSVGASYSEACKIIDEFAHGCLVTLKSGRPFHLPRVGRLYPGTEGIIHFEQDQSTNLNPDAFGLGPFISPPVVRSYISRNFDWNSSAAVAKPARKKIMLPRLLKWAAIIALPVGIAAVIGVTQYGRMSADPANNAAILSPVFTKPFTASTVVKKEASASSAVHKVATPKPTPPATAEIATARHEGNYAVIVGAFRIEENAGKLVAELQQKGFRASVFDQSKTGLYRVTIGTSSNRDEARQLLASVKSTDFSSAWILAK